MSDDHASPTSYHTIVPYLLLRNAASAIAYYTKVFGAVETTRFDMDGGKVGHAELRIGDTIIMLADEVPDMNYLGPQSLGGSSVTLMIHVDNADDVFKQAVDAGATVDRPLADQFYGYRTGCIVDPFGHQWTIAHRIEDVSDEEAKRRFSEMQGGGD